MIGVDSIQVARTRIAPHIRSTPTALSTSLSERCGVPVWLKLEHHQVTGSFKLRGAINAVLQLSDAQRGRGVIAVSTGNHGRALAYAARKVGSRATICMSRLVPQNKVDEIRRLGADVRIIGASQDEAEQEVERLVAEEGMVVVPPFDDPCIVNGQGTIGLDLVEAVPDLETVLVGVSGGGLAAGIATAVKQMRPRAKVIGVTMRRGAAMKASIDAGKPIQVPEFPSLADALGGGIGLDNKWTFKMCRDLLDDIVLLEEADIASGMRHAYVQEREVLEGSGAVGIAALVADRIPNLHGPVAIVLTGRNVDMKLHQSVMNGSDDPFAGDA
ncbi:MAG: hydroxyectoine utilization dehydratase EutB [Lautropia sp.]